MLFYMHMQKASQKLKYMMDQVSQWLTKSCLYLNVKKTIGIVFLLKGISGCRSRYVCPGR